MAAFTGLMLFFTWGTIMLKHRQFQTARTQLEQYYMTKMKQQAAELQTELKAAKVQQDTAHKAAIKQVNEQLAKLTSMAEDASKASNECRLALKDLKREANQVAGQKTELSQELATLRARLGDTQSSLESEHKQLAAAQSLLEQDKQHMRWVNDQAAKMGMLKHVVRLGTQEDMEQHQELAALLKETANKNNEVLLAVCDHSAAAPVDYLTPWLHGVARVGLDNALLITTDTATQMKAKAAGANAIYVSLENKIQPGPNAEANARAAKKAKAIQMILSMGYAVLYTDLDVVLTGDPFKHLMRDVDVEIMTDSWDDSLAYGRTEMWQDRQSGDHLNVRIAGVSPGIMYLRPLQANLDLVQQLVARLTSGKDSEAAVLNKLLLAVPHGADGPNSPASDPSPTRLRILPLLKYMSSKALFTAGAKDAFLATHEPVAIHMNYHSNKLERMAAIVERYHGRPQALEAMEDEESGAGSKAKRTKRSLWLL